MPQVGHQLDNLVHTESPMFRVSLTTDEAEYACSKMGMVYMGSSLICNMGWFVDAIHLQNRWPAMYAQQLSGGLCCNGLLEQQSTRA